MASTEDNPYTSPQLRPEDGEPHVKRPRHFMSPAPLEYGEGTDPSPMGSLVLRAYLMLGVGVAMGYVALAMIYPTIWAILTGILFATALGLITTKIVLRIDNPRRMWCLTPLFGAGWLLLLWVLFWLASLFS
jgi:hypothetical protein